MNTTQHVCRMWIIHIAGRLAANKDLINNVTILGWGKNTFYCSFSHLSSGGCVEKIEQIKKEQSTVKLHYYDTRVVRIVYTVHSLWHHYVLCSHYQYAAGVSAELFSNSLCTIYLYSGRYFAIYHVYCFYIASPCFPSYLTCTYFLQMILYVFLPLRCSLYCCNTWICP